MLSVIGNKIDLNDEKCIRFNKSARFTKDNHCNYFECSVIIGKILMKFLWKLLKIFYLKSMKEKKFWKKKKIWAFCYEWRKFCR